MGRLLLVLSLFGFAGSVRADDAWRVPAGCPERTFAQRRLRELRVDPAWLGRGRAEVTIEPAPTGGLRARVLLRGHERRVFYDPSCAALAEAVLLVLSVVFEGAKVNDELPLANVAAQSAPTESSSDTRLQRDRRQLGLSALAVVDRGSLPGASVAFGGSLRGRIAESTLELAGSYSLARARSKGDRSGEFGLATGTVRACQALWRASGWALAPCVALELGRARGREEYEARGLWGAVLAGVSLAVGPFYRVSPIFDFELAIPFRRPSFEVDDAGALFQARQVVTRGTLRLALDLF